MDEDGDGRIRLIGLIVVAALLVGAWLWWKRSGAAETVDQTVDVFVPSAESFEQRRRPIDEARQVVDLINERQRGDQPDE